jgi:histone H3/H4
MFFPKTLEGILASFEKTAADLARHIERKTQEASDISEQKKRLEFKLTANNYEVQRAERVLTKVNELIS